MDEPIFWQAAGLRAPFTGSRYVRDGVFRSSAERFPGDVIDSTEHGSSEGGGRFRCQCLRRRHPKFRFGIIPRLSLRPREVGNSGGELYGISAPQLPGRTHRMFRRFSRFRAASPPINEDDLPTYLQDGTKLSPVFDHGPPGERPEVALKERCGVLQVTSLMRGRWDGLGNTQRRTGSRLEPNRAVRQ